MLTELGVEEHLQNTVKKGNQEVTARQKEEESCLLCKKGSAVFRVIEAQGRQSESHSHSRASGGFLFE